MAHSTLSGIKLSLKCYLFIPMLNFVLYTKGINEQKITFINTLKYVYTHDYKIEKPIVNTLIDDIKTG